VPTREVRNLSAPIADDWAVQRVIYYSVNEGQNRLLDVSMKYTPGGQPFSRGRAPTVAHVFVVGKDGAPHDLREPICIH
jgi:hypothetical protein